MKHTTIKCREEHFVCNNLQVIYGLTATKPEHYLLFFVGIFVGKDCIISLTSRVWVSF